MWITFDNEKNRCINKFMEAGAQLEISKGNLAPVGLPFDGSKELL